MRPDFRDFRGSGLLVLAHSAKGSTWNNHKYIKRINGTYYYPDSYVGGRHLPSGSKDDPSDNKLEDWEEQMYQDIAKTLERNPGLFDVSQITDDNWQDFRLTLAEFAGIDSEKLSDAEVERMREKVKDYYEARTLSSDDVERLAKEVIRGNFGSGQTRRDALGVNYQQVQDRVNEILRGSSGSTKVSKAPEETVKAGEDAVNKAVKAASSTAKGMDYETIFGVYRKKK